MLSQISLNILCIEDNVESVIIKFKKYLILLDISQKYVLPVEMSGKISDKMSFIGTKWSKMSTNVSFSYYFVMGIKISNRNLLIFFNVIGEIQRKNKILF